jgi:hypothetical protein
MRKLILIAAMSLLASQAYAGGPRSLSLAATNASLQATEQPATPTAGTTQSPTAAQPPATQTATTTPASATAGTTTTPAATTSAAPAQATTTKPKRRSPSVEARVVRELHRHGIYW